MGNERVFLTGSIHETLAIKKSTTLLLLASIGLNVLLGVAILSLRPQTSVIVLPSVDTPLKDGWVFNDERPSDNYLESWSVSTLSLLTNWTPSTVDHNLEDFLKRVDPLQYTAIESKLRREAQTLKGDHASSLFFVRRVATDAQDLTVQIEGIQKQLIGRTVTSDRRVIYELKYRYQAGQLFVVGVGTVDEADSFFKRR